jgi:lipopolysaccharide/colanic/teichoic acid biosynthesis glycosyltransferase
MAATTATSIRVSPRVDPTLDADALVGREWMADTAAGPSVLVPEVELPWIKRVLDVVGAVALLLLSLPLLAAAAVAIKVTDGGPVFFRQHRVGLGGKMFEIVKLRTMSPNAEALAARLAGADCTDGLLFRVPCDPRVTRVGVFLRRSAIDELPQLWNVLRGEMSLVGPRPLAVEADAFAPREHLRHAVKPGITGAWQVAGGNDLPWADMIALDIDYAFGWSVARDLGIMLRTVPALAGRVGPS